jgi:hypothetical protein
MGSKQVVCLWISLSHIPLTCSRFQGFAGAQFLEFRNLTALNWMDPWVFFIFIFWGFPNLSSGFRVCNVVLELSGPQSVSYLRNLFCRYQLFRLLLPP